MYKNIDKQTKLTLKELVEYQEGQVVSKTLVQNDYVSMTIFSFDKGEEISTHAAGGDAMVTVLEGKGRFTVGDEVFYVEEGETLIMPKDIPHAVYGGEIQDAADRVFLNYKSCCIYRLCGTNIHAGGIFLPFVFRILPLELGENMMVPIG